MKKIALGFCFALSLTACGHDDNPLLTGKPNQIVTSKFTTILTHQLNKKPCHDIFCRAMDKTAMAKQLDLKLAHTVQCPYYFANPAKEASLKTVCEAWMTESFAPEYQHWWPNYAADNNLHPATLTDDDLRDPLLWQSITKAMDTIKKEHGVTP